MRACRAGGCVVVLLATALVLSACTSGGGTGPASGNDVSTQAVCAKYRSLIGANGRGGMAPLDNAVRLGTRAKDTTLRKESKQMAADLQDPVTRRFLSALSQSASFNPPEIPHDNKTKDLFHRVETIPSLCKGLLRAPLTG
jgi:hypothetical protein